MTSSLVGQTPLPPRPRQADNGTERVRGRNVSVWGWLMEQLHLSDRREPGDTGDLKRFQLSLSTVIQIVVYVVAVAMAYSALNARVAVLENKYDQIIEDVREIKSDLKILLSRKP